MNRIFPSPATTSPRSNTDHIETNSPKAIDKDEFVAKHQQSRLSVTPPDTGASCIGEQKVAQWVASRESPPPINVRYQGHRYNDFRNDPPFLKAHVFLDNVLFGWALVPDSVPFALDCESDVVIVSYVYDNGEIWKSSLPPEGFSIGEQNGDISYYRVDMKGANVPTEAQRFRFWIARDADGRVLNSGWIESEDSPIIPEFAWQALPLD